MIVPPAPEASAGRSRRRPARRRNASSLTTWLYVMVASMAALVAIASLVFGGIRTG